MCQAHSNAACSHQRADAPVPEGEPVVHCLKEALQVSEQRRWVHGGHDMDFPPVPFPSNRVILITGEPLLRSVVREHHERLRRLPDIGDLFPRDNATFDKVVERIADFVVEACGGPSRYTEAQGHTCMRTRHFPFTIDESARESWLKALWSTLEDLNFPAEVREEYWAWLEAMSIRMINRRTTKEQPRRYPYSAMHIRAAA